MKKKIIGAFAVLLCAALMSAPFASAQYTDSITVLGGLGAISRDALEEMLDLVACKCAGGGGCECGSGGGGACACECTCEICTFLKAHPVGSIYMGTTSANPQTTYGGEWEQWGQGRVPVGAAGNGVNPSFTDYDGFLKTFAAGETGGEYRHTLAIPEIPAHAHWLNDHTHSIATHFHTVDDHTHTANHTHNWNIYDAEPGNLRATLSSADLFLLTRMKNSVLSGDMANGLTGGGSWNNANWNALSFRAQLATANVTTSSAGAGNTSTGGPTSTGAAGGDTGSTGDGGAHNNVQPYVTCYMWKRTGEGTSLCANTGCNCDGGGGTGGGCDCEPYTATLPISITDNDISIDLSGYVTTGDLTTALGNYVTTGSLTSALAAYYDTTDIETWITGKSYITSTSLATTLTGYVTTSGLATALGGYYTKGEVDTLLAAQAMVYPAANSPGVASPTAPGFIERKTGEKFNGADVYITRFTGTITTVGATVPESNMVLLSGVPPQWKVVDFGGWYAYSTAPNYGRMALGAYTSQNYYSSFYITAGATGSMTFTTYVPSNRTNAPFDIWVKYTKDVPNWW